MRKRRSAAKPHDRVAGAWDELTDRFSELGYDGARQAHPHRAPPRASSSRAPSGSPRSRLAPTRSWSPDALLPTRRAMRSGARPRPRPPRRVTLSPVRVDLLARYRVRLARDLVRRLTHPRANRQDVARGRRTMSSARPCGAHPAHPATSSSRRTRRRASATSRVRSRCSTRRAAVRLPAAPVLRVLDDGERLERTVDRELTPRRGAARLRARRSRSPAQDEDEDPRRRRSPSWWSTEGPDTRQALPLTPGSHHLGRDAGLSPTSC